MTSPAMTGETHCLSTVMPGLMPGINVFTPQHQQRRGWHRQVGPCPTVATLQLMRHKSRVNSDLCDKPGH